MSLSVVLDAERPSFTVAFATHTLTVTHTTVSLHTLRGTLVAESRLLPDCCLALLGYCLDCRDKSAAGLILGGIFRAAISTGYCLEFIDDAVGVSKSHPDGSRWRLSYPLTPDDWSLLVDVLCYCAELHDHEEAPDDGL